MYPYQQNSFDFLKFIGNNSGHNFGMGYNSGLPYTGLSLPSVFSSNASAFDVYYSSRLSPANPQLPGLPTNNIGGSIPLNNYSSGGDMFSQMFQLMFLMKAMELQGDGGKDVSSEDYNGKIGKRLVRIAEKNINKRGAGTGLCAMGVRLALEDVLGEKFEKEDAYKWSKTLKERADFEKIQVKSSDLKKLPAGAIVVWGKTKESPHGHISIADGKGNEISDHKDKQKTDLRGHKNFEVFVPVG